MNGNGPQQKPEALCPKPPTWPPKTNSAGYMALFVAALRLEFRTFLPDYLWDAPIRAHSCFKNTSRGPAPVPQRPDILAYFLLGSQRDSIALDGVKVRELATAIGSSPLRQARTVVYPTAEGHFGGVIFRKSSLLHGLVTSGCHVPRVSPACSGGL